MNDYFTNEGEKWLEKAMIYGLRKFYDEFNGSFCFTDEQFEQNRLKIRKWLRKYQNYCVIYSENYWIMLPQENLE